MSDPVEFLQSRVTSPFNSWSVPDLPKNPTIALSNSADQSAELVRRQPNAIDIRIALTPDAAHGFLVAGEEYFAVEDFFDVRVFKAADDPMLKLQSSWSDQVDQFGWQALPELKECQLRPAGDYFFFLKQLSDMLYKTTFSLTHLILTANPKRVIYFDYGDSEEHVDDTLYFTRSIYSEMLPLIAEQNGAELESKTTPKRGGVNPLSRTYNLKRRIKPQTLTRMKQARRAGISRLLSAALGSKSGQIIYQNAYDIPFVMNIMRDKGFSTQATDELLALTHGKKDTDLKAALQQLWPRLRSEPFFTRPFSWAGCDTVNIAEAQLKHWWLNIIPRIYATSQSLRRQFATSPPKATVISSATTPEEHALLHAARYLKVPTFTYQHGGFEGNCDYSTYDMTDLRQSDHRIAYGELTADYFNRRADQYNEPRAKTFAAGSPRLDKIGREGDSGSKRTLDLNKQSSEVLYVPTIYSDNWYLSQSAYLSVPYFELLLHVTQLMRRSENHFIYKTFPGLSNDPIATAIANDCPNASVVSDIPASQLIWSCDAVVIDHPSTVLLEAMLTKKPIFVFSDSRYLSLRPEARELLQKRVALCEDHQLYLPKLQKFLRSSLKELSDPNDEFLLAYGTHLNDGRSAERAANLLESII